MCGRPTTTGGDCAQAQKAKQTTENAEWHAIPELAAAPHANSKTIRITIDTLDGPHPSSMDEDRGRVLRLPCGLRGFLREEFGEGGQDYGDISRTERAFVLG